MGSHFKMMIEARLTEPDINEILAYLGSNYDAISAEEKKTISECTEMVKKASAPSLVYKIVPVNDGNIVGLSLPGKDIRKLLEEADNAVIFAATLGPDVDRLITRLQVTDMAKAVICDAAASACIENVCDNFESDARNMEEANGLSLTYRYSPGYGDLPIFTQKDVTEFLNCRRRIGLGVTDTYMMTPVKSVTAIMGIVKPSSDKIIPTAESKCERCSKRDTCSRKR